ncbi:16467_t:CDS:2 [Funneliformis caledonium]|uniref:16467_t:CDS:1 n=1 Tax=Funneliformis caledonium TaxID=1117310 RepID=A0A9N8VJU2_9GLOM|nr:16467_t:CDS:2 [Funneliformis caledonium]
MSKTSKAYDQQIDLDNLDLKRTYTLEEFEYINNQLKNRTLEIDGKPINLFELDENGKLIPMPQATYNMELVVTEIARQLSNWNIFTRQGGSVTTSQGGFKFGTEESEDEITTQAGKKIRGEPFTPIFVVEVGDIRTDTTNSAFIKADNRFKDEYFEDGTSIQLGFTLRISSVDYCTSQEDSETSSENESPVLCNKCEDTFNSRYEYLIYYEEVHICKNKRRRIQE